MGTPSSSSKLRWSPSGQPFRGRSGPRRPIPPEAGQPGRLVERRRRAGPHYSLRGRQLSAGSPPFKAPPARPFRQYLRFVPKHINAPVLLLLAEHDRIIDNARARRFGERLVNPDRVVIEYPGTHHTLEFEPDPDRFLNDLRQWLERHNPSRGSRPREGLPWAARIPR